MPSHSGPASGPAGFGQIQAFGLLVLYCIIYVLPLYASAATRPSPTRSRDAPDAIRARIRAVSVSTAACSLITLLILYNRRPPYDHGDDGRRLGPWQLMGHWPLDLSASARAVLLTAVLFAGPLYEHLVIDGGWREWSRLEPLREVWRSWPAWRNLVAGPVTEECLFRSAAVPLLLLAGTSQSRIIYLSPLVFGLAHLHHFYEFRLTNPQVSLAAAVARTVLQLSYTSLFGMYATFVFIRTGSLPAIILIHTFCNYMGLPRVWGFIEPYWLNSRNASPSTTPAIWTALYYLLLVGGLVSWCLNLYPLTRSSTALAEL